MKLALGTHLGLKDPEQIAERLKAYEQQGFQSHVMCSVPEETMLAGGRGLQDAARAYLSLCKLNPDCRVVEIAMKDGLVEGNMLRYYWYFSE